jgi:deoxyribodipyrimidine photo-lyase
MNLRARLGPTFAGGTVSRLSSNPVAYQDLLSGRKARRPARPESPHAGLADLISVARLTRQKHARADPAVRGLVVDAKGVGGFLQGSRQARAVSARHSVYFSSINFFAVQGRCGGRAIVNSVMVFTRDLRVSDNPALSAAIDGATATVPLFVLDEDMLTSGYGEHAGRLGFLRESLADLDASLRERGAQLVVRRGDWAETVVDVGRAASASVIHLAADVSGYASRRLTRLRKAAASARMAVRTHPGVTVVPPEALRPSGSQSYQVFTPYYRRWLDVPRRSALPSLGRVTLPAGTDTGQVPDLRAVTGATRTPNRPRGGELAGQRRLRTWTARDLAGYPAERDNLAGDRTSRLSAYLHLGCVSPVQVEAELRARAGGDAVIRQLAWRDFFSQLLAAHPRAAVHDFKDRADDWADDPDALAAWQAGQTGYPVVDAGMRQLAAEGFMHGRARMITASFLTKDLHLDWRLGAAHFLRHLVDGDIACNQLNWQWVAGTGTDTRPGRMLNPTLQSRTYDHDGGYIRRWIPELAHLPATEIHDPSRAARRSAGYPEPVTDHAAAAAAYRARQRRHRPVPR